ATAQLTVCLVLLSAICIYLPCRWDFRPVRLKIGWEQYWLPAAYVLLALTFPAVLYKNYEYLNYVRTHGGYFAIYTDSQAVLQTVGFLPRLLSLLASNTFLVVFVMERRSRLLFAVSCVFFSSSLLELLMGFRGKVFILVLTLWFLHILKTGKRFRLLPLAISASLLSLVGVVVAGFRENTEVALLSPLGFLSAQGISMQVTELAIELKQAFHTHALYYFWNEFKVGFYPGSQFGPGQLFANDLSIALNATAYDLGFGTGSAYLAEAYIAGGIFFVAAASAFVGLALRFLHKLGGHFIGAVVVAVVMPSIIYMPRCGLIEPVSVGTRNLISLSLVFPILWAIRWVAQIGWHRLHIYEENS
ncbi:MAG: O-antigen polysaccharide polymerase Wzy, partial [Acidobacteriaceae bacterium]|nr:O-antigen polysaccharide polymerase Wzy [Acidobacteriaceae bacterium]